MSFIGIDFGTTKTVAAVFKGGQPTIIPDRWGHRSIPSLVLVTPEEELFVGWEAVTHPRRYESKHITINSIKRSLGKQGETGWGWWKTHPQEVAALILGRMKLEVEAYLGEEITDAVIAIPAHFDINQRWAVKQAAEIAGLRVPRLLNEATAAALTYYVTRAPGDASILVFDFGGGTLDVSILKIGQGVCEVKATAGDGWLGGDDFDQIIVDYILERVREQVGASLTLSPFQQTVIREAATKAKIELSGAQSSRIYLPGLIQTATRSYDLDLTITRDTFYSLSNVLIERTIGPLFQALSDAKMTRSDLNAALLIGGTSRMPAIQEIVRKVLSLEPHIGVDPETCVAEGAAIAAGVLAGDIKNVLLLDVLPLSLSVATMGGTVTRLIERNTTIPNRRSEVFSTTEYNQTQIEINIFEGEREFARDNRFVSKVTLSGIPPAPRGVPQIEITLDVDANGICNVIARDRATGKQTTATLAAPFQLNPAQVKVMQRAIGRELTKIKDRLARESEMELEEAIRRDAKSWEEKIDAFLTARGRHLTEKQAFILSEGRRLIVEHVQRGTSWAELQSLLSGVRQEFDNILTDLIARSMWTILNDPLLALWATKAATRLHNDESVTSSMKDFEAHYRPLIKSVLSHMN